MAFQYDVSFTSATYAEAMFRFKELAKAAGWTVPRSSDGLTYNAAGDQITVVGTGAGGMNNSLAWFVLQQPATGAAPFAGTRQMVVQRSSGFGHTYRIKYSFSAGFTGGTPGITRVPSATDEQVLLGSGTDASPTAAALFINPTEGVSRFNIAVDDGTATDNKFAFYLFSIPVGGGSLNGVWLFDPMQSGSFPYGVGGSQDNDPYCHWVEGAGANTNNLDIESGVSSIKCWLKKGLAGEGFVTTGAMKYVAAGNNVVFPSGIGTNPHNSKDDALPVVLARRAALAAPSGYKGVSTLMRWNGTLRSVCDTFTLSTTSDRVVLGTINLPWNGTVPTV
jgi:hypothetical protein